MGWGGLDIRNFFTVIQAQCRFETLDTHLESIPRQENMKTVAVFAVFVVFCVGLALSKPQDQDSLNITRLLNNEAVVRKQINCLLDRAPCDQIGNRLKKSIPEVVNRDCRACTPQQAKNARRLVTFIQQRDPQAWQQIQAKYRG